ncbi:MAG: 30S ribosome-binding factor RbfA [Oscillospiraceae bacterium]|nr:30S ribosome-binding factor RbfA [Oscillospiraceae bacterium]
MASNRTLRINEEIQKVLSEDIRTLKDPRVQGLISVTEVEATGDLRYAKVYISVLEKERSKEVLKGLKSASGFLRRSLGTKLQLRYTPELIFVEDNSIERGAHIFDILSKLDIPEDDADESAK